MSAAFVVGHGVDLVDDHRLNIAQNRPALLRGQQDVQRLRRGHQNVRRTLQHRPPLVHQRVASADRGANLRHQEPALARHLKNFAERYFKVLLDVVAQRLQRRNVEDFSTVLKIARQCLPHQPINAGEKSGESLARTGGRGDQRGVTCQNVRPSLLLRLSRSAETLDEPIPDEGMGPSEG